MLSWQVVQAIKVLRRRFAMIRTHAGFSLRPGLFSQNLVNQTSRDLRRQHPQPDTPPRRPTHSHAATHRGIICNHEAPV